MAKKKFINMIKDFLGLEETSDDSKTKRIKALLEKLKKKKKEIKEELDKGPTKKRKRELEEDLDITKYHIKKGHDILNK